MKLLPFKKMSLSDEVKSYIYDYIKNMDLKENTRLPAEEAIAQSLSVSRVTVRKALTDLEQEGIVFRIHGKGTFANPEAMQIKVNINFGNELEQLIIDSGYKAKVEVVNMEIKPAGYKVADRLQIGHDELVVRIEKIFYADEHPAILCIDMFPSNLIDEEILDRYLMDSTFELLRKKAGKIVTWDKVDMYVATKEQSMSHSSYVTYMDNAAFLIFETTNYDQDNSPVLFDLELYDTNFIRFNIIRQKNLKYN